MHSCADRQQWPLSGYFCAAIPADMATYLVGDSEAQERTEIRTLVHKHGGNLSAVAEALGSLSLRDAVRRRVTRYGLHDELNAAALQGGVQGRKLFDGLGGKALDAGRAAERVRLVKAIAAEGSYRAAVKALDMPLRTLTRRITELGITQSEIRRSRKALPVLSRKVSAPRRKRKTTRSPKR